MTHAVDPLSVMCPACLVPPNEPCYATSSDLPRPVPHRLRGMSAASNLERCPHCDGIGWTPRTPENGTQ